MDRGCRDGDWDYWGSGGYYRRSVEEDGLEEQELAAQCAEEEGDDAEVDAHCQEMEYHH